MNKTFNEIVEVLKSKLSVDDFAFEEFSKEDLDLGEIEQVSSIGGEDEGSFWQKVRYFKDHGVYIAVEGRYSSDWGIDFGEWDDKYTIYEVFPKQKIITVYESK